MRAADRASRRCGRPGRAGWHNRVHWAKPRSPDLRCLCAGSPCIASEHGRVIRAGADVSFGLVSQHLCAFFRDFSSFPCVPTCVCVRVCAFSCMTPWVHRRVRCRKFLPTCAGMLAFVRKCMYVCGHVYAGSLVSTRVCGMCACLPLQVHVFACGHACMCACLPLRVRTCVNLSVRLCMCLAVHACVSTRVSFSFMNPHAHHGASRCKFEKGRARARLPAHAHVLAHVRECMHGVPACRACVRACGHVCTCLFTCACAHSCLYACSCVCICVCMYARRHRRR